jgi:hypothetical protein
VGRRRGTAAARLGGVTLYPQHRVVRIACRIRPSTIGAWQNELTLTSTSASAQPPASQE